MGLSVAAATVADMDRELWSRITDTITMSREHDRVTSREAFRSVWDDTPPTEHVLRCVIAHYAADCEDAPEHERAWDESALREFELAPEEGWAEVGIADPTGMLPSLHLNLADVAHRCGDVDVARTHLVLATEHLQRLPDDAYGATVRTGVEGVRERIGSAG